MKRILLFLLCCLALLRLPAQNDSCGLRISLLTCGPGDDLYSLWGHSALRVTDMPSHTDLVYNYGTFDFTDPDFYIKFVKGKLLYFVGTEAFSDFVEEYQADGRSIIEQQLLLNCEERRDLAQALRVNAQEENKYYFYQFLFDNCSTRVRDILLKNLRDSAHIKNILPSPVPTFRSLIHVYLDQGGQYWSKLGIDLALGSLIDREPTNQEAMFLPDYLMKGFDSASIHDTAVVGAKRQILPGISRPVDNNPLFSPVHTTVFLLVLGVALSLLNSSWSRRILNVLDVTLFVVTGAIGCFLLFMWVGTAHDLTADNYNLLWALPLNLPAAFFVLKNSSWVRKYLMGTAVFYLLLVLFWSLIPQGMNPAFLPIAMLMGMRSFARTFKRPAR